MSNNWLETDMLEDYLDGKLDAKAMHFIERMALEDPFVSDALEGLRQSPRRKQSISILQRQLKQRLELQPEKRKVWRLTTHRLSIGATAAVLFIAASIIFWMQETNNREKRKQGKQVEVNMASELIAASERENNLGYTVYPQFAADIQQDFAPSGGWVSFREYIVAKNQLLAYPIQHSLTVTFGIDPNGRPMRIRVNNARELKYTKEAIRLLREGPRWEVVGKGQQPGNVVSVKMYF